MTTSVTPRVLDGFRCPSPNALGFQKKKLPAIQNPRGSHFTGALSQKKGKEKREWETLQFHFHIQHDNPFTIWRAPITRLPWSLPSNNRVELRHTRVTPYDHASRFLKGTWGEGGYTRLEQGFHKSREGEPNASLWGARLCNIVSEMWVEG